MIVVNVKRNEMRDGQRKYICAMLQKTAIELKLEIKSESIIHFLVLWSTEENQLNKGCIRQFQLLTQRNELHSNNT